MRTIVAAGRRHAARLGRHWGALLVAGLGVACSSGNDSDDAFGPNVGSGSGSASNSDKAFLLPQPNTFQRAEVQIAMDDGVMITAEEFIPDGVDKVPTVVAFYPYGRKGDIAGDHFSFPAEYGYAKLTVDVRGTGASEGVWDLFGPREQQDYTAIIQWATTRPYNDGSVVLMGVSAGAITALLAAQQPGTEAVKAVFARTPNADAYRDNGNSGGSPNTSFLLAWAGGTIGVPSLYQPALSGQSNPQVALNATSQHLSGTVPFILGGLLGPVFGSYQENLPPPFQGVPAGAYDSEWYRVRSPLTHIDRITAPTLMIGANFDLFQRTQPMLYDALPLPPDRKKLVMVNAYHFFPPEVLSSSDGSVLVRDSRNNVVPADNNLRVAWFDHWAKGVNNGIERMPTVEQAYTGHEGYTAQDSALPTRRAVRYYLDGGGVLGLNPASAPGQGELLYQPLSGLCSKNPIQNIGGGSPNPGGSSLPISVPRPSTETPCTTDNSVNERDGLTFTTAPVAQTTRIAGPANLALWISSTRPDASLFATITDVAPDGTSTQVSYGHLIASHRRLVETPCTGPAVIDCSVYLDGELIQPWHPYTREAQEDLTTSEIYQLDIEVMPMFVELQPGHALRLTIKTGDFPKAVPTLSVLEDSLGGMTTVLYDAEHPSSVVLGEVVQ